MTIPHITRIIPLIQRRCRVQVYAFLEVGMTNRKRSRLEANMRRSIGNVPGCLTQHLPRPGFIPLGGPQAHANSRSVQVAVE